MAKQSRKQVSFYLDDDLVTFVESLPRSVNLSSLIRGWVNVLKQVVEKSGAGSLPQSATTILTQASALVLQGIVAEGSKNV